MPHRGAARLGDAVDRGVGAEDGVRGFLQFVNDATGLPAIQALLDDDGVAFRLPHDDAGAGIQYNQFKLRSWMTLLHLAPSCLASCSAC